MADAEWFYVGHYGQLGPLTFEQMEELVHDGVIERDTYVWRSTMPDWSPAGAVIELSPLFQGSLQPPAVPVSPPPTPIAPASQFGISPPPYDWLSAQPYFPRSDKSRITAGLLNFLPGVGRIYLGYTAHGIIQMFLALWCGIGWAWSIIDGIVMLCGGVKTDGYGRRLDD